MPVPLAAFTVFIVGTLFAVAIASVVVVSVVVVAPVVSPVASSAAYPSSAASATTISPRHRRSCVGDKHKSRICQ